MKNPSVKMSLQAFVIGGLVGAVAQGFFAVFMMFVPNPGMAINFALFAIAALGGVLTALGIFAKLDKVGGMGVNVPTFGLGAATVGPIIGARMAGKSMAKAALEGLLEPLKLLGVAAVIGFVGAVIKLLIG